MPAKETVTKRSSSVEGPTKTTTERKVENGKGGGSVEKHSTSADGKGGASSKTTVEKTVTNTTRG